MSELQQWARENYELLTPILAIWHPEIQDECGRMNMEELDRLAAEKEKSKARIGEVIAETADFDVLMTGKISYAVHFKGSVQKSRPMTEAEAKLVMTLPETIKVKLKGQKPLFESPEYDALTGWIEKRREEFKAKGVPNIVQTSCTVVSITLIPEIEDLAEQTERELPLEVEKFIAAFPEQIKKAEEKLGPLFNLKDYPDLDSIRSRYKFRYDWVGYGAMEALKQTNIAYYEKAMRRQEELWAEIEANGVLMLRNLVLELTDGLIEALSPKANGEKKKFYVSSVTKITDFIEDFKKRNVFNDQELDQKLAEMRDLMAGIDLKKVANDTRVRDEVKAKVEAARESFSSLVTEASARVFKFSE